MATYSAPRKANQQMPPLPEGAASRLSPQRVPSIGQGSHPAYTDQAIISVPDHTTSRQGDGLISVPGGAAATAYNLDKPRYIQQRSVMATPIETIVYFKDQTGLSLSVEDGQNISAGELFELAKEEMKLSDEAREMFSLWLVSDLLELQLKPDHVPFKLVCYWEELLEKYTNADDEAVQRDEPIISFQRNVFYSRAKEMKTKDSELLRLLYHEAKENVVDGRYPMDLEEANYLAGLQALINHQHYDPDMHSVEYYRSLVDEYYSEHLSKKKSMFSRRTKLDEHLRNSHRKTFNQYGSLYDQPQQTTNVHLGYLKKCWALPYYGSAFFLGQIEHPGQPMFRSVEDDPVYIAVNTAGVFIIDMDDVEYLMGVLYEGLSWEYAEPKDKENRNCTPCLFFSFQDKEKNRSYIKVLQVFSKEAKMVDSLIETSMKLKAERKRLKEDVSDGIVDEDNDNVIESEGATWRNFNRLCLTVFDKTGHMVGSNARGIQASL